MLDTHPDVSIPGETYMLEQLGRRRDKFMQGDRFRRDEFERELFDDSRFWNFYVAPEVVRDELDRCGPGDLAEAIRCVYRAHARQVGATRWADKTPNYAGCVPLIADLLPESVFIHLHRDPREVTGSYLNADWRNYSVGSASAHWRANVHAAERAAGLGPSRFRRIGYQTLVDEPEQTLRDLCEFLALSFDPAMLDYAHGRVASLESVIHSNAHHNLTSPPKHRTRDWRTDLRPAQITRVEVMARPYIDRFGYEPPSSRWSSMRLAAEVERLMRVPVARLELRIRGLRSINRLRPRARRLRGWAPPEIPPGLSDAN